MTRLEVTGLAWRSEGPFRPVTVALLASISMELAIRIHVKPEGLFLATSDELSGLVAQGRTVAEAIDIARDVARKLIRSEA